MKKYFYLLICVLILNSCGNKNSTKDDANSKNEELVLAVVDSKTLVPNLEKNLVNANDKKVLQEYITWIKSDLKTEEQILNAFSLRRKLMTVLDNYLYDIYDKIMFSENGEYNENADAEWMIIEKELQDIGIICNYMEGNFSGIGDGKILEPQILASESRALQLYSEYLSNYALTIGSEYPYSELTTDMELLVLGDELIQKFPDFTFVNEIDSLYYYSVLPFTDFHKNISDNGEYYEYYTVWGTSTDEWPNMTDISFHNELVAKYPDLNISKIVKKILENTSEIYVDADGAYTVYLIEIENTTDYEYATKKIKEFIKQGIDIPHLVSNYENEVSTYSIVYRFYSDKTRSESEMKKIIKQFPKAKIVEFSYEFIGGC